MLKFLRCIAYWLKVMYFKQNKQQRELWSKMFHALAVGAAVGVGMKYLSDNISTNNTQVFYWAGCAIMFHIFSLIALMGGDEDDDDDSD